MSWIAELHDLYEKNEYRAGIYDESGAILVPVFHTTVAAQITVTIDQDGNFLRAEAVPEVLLADFSVTGIIVRRS